MSIQEGTQTSIRRPRGGTELVVAFENADESPDVPNPLPKMNRGLGSASNVAAAVQALAQTKAATPPSEPMVVIEGEGGASQ